MSSLAEIQLRIRNAIVTGDSAGIAPMLVGGRHPEKRLAIHRRHYETSLVTALLEKFQATAWLAGISAVTEAARRFVRDHPPHAPCIAEYGEEFPEFLSVQTWTARMPYLSEFATLEWHVGHVAVAIDRRALSLEDFSSVHADALPETRLALQPGLRYVQASWPVDELLKLYVSDAAPDSYTFEPAEVRIEVRGARGEFRLDRLDTGAWVFRKSISEGLPLGDSAGRALDADPAFDARHALAALVTGGRVARIQSSTHL